MVLTDHLSGQWGNLATAMDIQIFKYGYLLRMQAIYSIVFLNVNIHQMFVSLDQYLCKK